jgi:4'-phosphopantetheinyl transferase
MPLYKTIPVSGGLIGVWQLTETSTDLSSSFSLHELESKDFLQYNYEKRKVEWMATRLLIKQLIGLNFRITYSQTGKPNLTHDRYKHLSISHSRDFVAVFIHEQLDVGLDIESITRNYNSVERKYLSDQEQIAANKNNMLQCLYWCAKEAIFKLVPDEGVEFRKQIHILPFDPKTEEQFIVRYTSESKTEDYQLHFQIFSGHCLVWALDNEQ